MSATVELVMKVVRMVKSVRLPFYGSPAAAAFDVAVSEYVRLRPHTATAVKTDLKIELPSGHLLLLIARSSTAQNFGIIVLTGLIDPDYRGEIKVQVFNYTDTDVDLNPADRIAQGIVLPVTWVKILEADVLGDTERGEAGFGRFTGR